MFDRYTIYSSPQSIQETLHVDVSDEYRPTYNASPTQIQPIITSEEKNKLTFLQWGLMSNWSNNKTSISERSINLASDKAFQKKSYQRQIQSKRCIIPLNGFYAWKQVAKKQRVPYYIFSPQAAILGLAGIWEEFEDIDGKSNQSFIIMTVSSSSFMSEFENDMPAILSPADSSVWLENESLEENKMLMDNISINHPDLNSHSVSPAMIDVTNNHKELIDPAPASDQLGNYTLFS